MSAGIAAFAFGPILPKAMIAAPRTTGLCVLERSDQGRHGLRRLRAEPAERPCRMRALERAALLQGVGKLRNRDVQGQCRDDQSVDQAIDRLLAIGRPSVL